MKTAVYPGSFDPVTKGHLDIIARAARVFDKLIVCVLSNPKKQGLFSKEQRILFLKEAAAAYANVQVEAYDGLLADFAAKVDAAAIVKGVRDYADFANESSMAYFNKALNEQAETFFLPANEHTRFISSTWVKELASLHIDVSPYTTDGVAQALKKHFFMNEGGDSHVER